MSCAGPFPAARIYHTETSHRYFLSSVSGAAASLLVVSLDVRMINRPLIRCWVQRKYKYGVRQLIPAGRADLETAAETFIITWPYV